MAEWLLQAALLRLCDAKTEYIVKQQSHETHSIQAKMHICSVCVSRRSWRYTSGWHVQQKASLILRILTCNLILQVPVVLLIMALHLQQYGSIHLASKATCLLGLLNPIVSLPHAIATLQDP